MRLGIIALLFAAGQAGAGEIVNIPAGTFVMGTSVDEIASLKERFGVGYPGVFDNETPERQVSLTAFGLDAHEVTNTRFLAFVQASPGWLRGQIDADQHNGDYLKHWVDGRYPAGQGDTPVVFVTWHAAQAFCQWNGGRLPTEAEWEYAARAGDDREFPWGDQEPSIERANYYLSGFDAPVAVGSYPPNEFGLYDMAGNVWEFVLDAWTDNHDPAALVDPVAGGWIEHEELPGIAGRRAVRGASYGGAVVNLRTRWRDSHVVTNAVGFVGFRCAYPATQP